MRAHIATRLPRQRTPATEAQALVAAQKASGLGYTPGFCIDIDKNIAPPNSGMFEVVPLSYTGLDLDVDTAIGNRRTVRDLAGKQQQD